MSNYYKRLNDIHFRWNINEYGSKVRDEKIQKVLDEYADEKFKILNKHIVVNWLSINDNVSKFTDATINNTKTLIKFDTGQIREYDSKWPIAIATHFQVE